MILLLSACAEEAATDTEAAFAPEYGSWAAHVGDTWGGDCALSDDQTYQHPIQEWRMEAARGGFAIRDEEGYYHACTLADRTFQCDLPVIADDFSSLGYDIRATYTPAWAGTFDDTTSLAGEYRVHAECEGDDCGMLTGYGPDFTTPCTATTPLDATLAE
jgi:hypothetical protein